MCLRVSLRACFLRNEPFSTPSHWTKNHHSASCKHHKVDYDVLPMANGTTTLGQNSGLVMFKHSQKLASTIHASIINGLSYIMEATTPTQGTKKGQINASQQHHCHWQKNWQRHVGIAISANAPWRVWCGYQFTYWSGASMTYMKRKILNAVNVMGVLKSPRMKNKISGISSFQRMWKCTKGFYTSARSPRVKSFSRPSK